jgi:CheY-like chemotaxis protein
MVPMLKRAATSSKPPPGQGPAASRRHGVPPPTATILVVEDDHALRDLLRLTLESRDYRVLAAADGAEALGIVERQAAPISLLVTDVTLPGMAGTELARRLAARGAGIKVLLLSGYARDPALLDPQVPFLQKPFRPLALLALVQDLLAAGAGQAS